MSRLLSEKTFLWALSVSIFVGAVLTWMQLSQFSDTRFETILERDFSGTETGMTIEPSGNRLVRRYDMIDVLSDNNTTKRVLQVKGRGAVYTTPPFKVDTQRSYRVSVVLRVTSALGNEEFNNIAIGLATFDADGEVQTDPPGAHRYGILLEAMQANGQWRTFTGFFKGEGNRNFNQFRVGTDSARVVLVLNRPDVGNFTTHIANIKVERSVR